MQKANLIMIGAGIVAGVTIGFFSTQWINRNTPTVPVTAPGGAMPAGQASGPPAPVMELIGKARQDPNNFDLQVQAAEMFFQIRRFDQAIEFLNQALRLKPNDETALTNLTAVLLEKGDNAEAQKTFQTLEKIKPANDSMKSRRDELRPKLKAK